MLVVVGVAVGTVARFCTRILGFVDWFDTVIEAVAALVDCEQIADIAGPGCHPLVGSDGCAPMNPECILEWDVVLGCESPQQCSLAHLRCMKYGQVCPLGICTGRHRTSLHHRYLGPVRKCRLMCQNGLRNLPISAPGIVQLWNTRIVEMIWNFIIIFIELATGKDSFLDLKLILQYELTNPENNWIPERTKMVYHQMSYILKWVGLSISISTNNRCGKQQNRLKNKHIFKYCLNSIQYFENDLQFSTLLSCIDWSLHWVSRPEIYEFK